MGTLEGASGGEGPAGTALALVLDGGDGTGINPVDGGGVPGGVELGGGLGSSELVSLVSEDALVLGGSPVGELVVADGVAGVGLVVLLDESINM